MGPGAWEWLADFLSGADLVVPVRDAVQLGSDLPTRTVILRHDVDGDLDNAVRMAELEAQAGFRGSYFVLHTAPYYHAGDALSPALLRSLEKIASLGHEIGLHNNAIRVGLETQRHPDAVLEEELAALRDRGFDVVGSSAHGDSVVLSTGAVNYEVFSELSKSSDPRTLRFESNGKTLETSLNPRPMKEFGLQYEAYGLGIESLYLADSEGRWEYPPQYIASEFARGRGRLQLLVHPEHWALSGEPIRLTAAGRRSGAKPSPRTLKIVARGDCCSRRAVHMNLDLFGGTVQYTKDEKARTDFFVDHAYVGSPKVPDIERYVALERIADPNHRYYGRCQTDRGTLAVRDADLLIMDSYSDMNFQAWRHRKKGWKIWAYMSYIRDRAEFDRDFESVGYLSFEDALQYNIRLIEHYRWMNGHIPVLYLHQPIHYYDKLSHRAEFVNLGAELEKAVPDLYYGVVDDAEMDPDDMDSSGPGQTLHFTGPAYRKMIDVALEKGLSQWLSPTQQAFRS